MQRAEETSRLLGVLEHARRRAAESMPGSPDWEAAMAGVEELESQLDALQSNDAAPRPPATPAHVLPFAARSLPDGQLVQGTLTGDPAVLSGMEQAIEALTTRVASRREFARELERLASAHGFVLESGAAALGGYVFYAWHRGSTAEGSAEG